MPESAPKSSKLTMPVAIVIAGVIIAAGLYFGLSKQGSSATTAAAGAAPTQQVNVKDIKTAGSPYIGQKDAPLTMAFWSDYQCPFCKAFEVGGVPQINDGANGIPPALPDIIKNYVDTGKLRIVFMDYAFLGNDSITAGEYGRSIWKLYPSQYFAWRTAMYKAQDQEGDVGFGNAKTIDQLIKSQFPKMDDAKIVADIAANKATYDAAMKADQAEGTKVGVNGTPGFVIGTKFIGGDAPYSTFKADIDSQLK